MVRREATVVSRMAEGAELKSENWVMVVSEQHRYQGVSYKSDIIVISGIPISIFRLAPLGLLCHCNATLVNFNSNEWAIAMTVTR